MIESRLVRYTFVLAAIILTIYAMIQARPLLQPLLFAIFFSILLSPFCGWMERHRVPRLLSVSIALISGILVLAGVGVFFFTQLTAFVGDVDLFRERLENILEASQVFLNRWFGFEGLLNLEVMQVSIQDFFKENTEALTRGLVGAATMITTIVIIPVFMFFMLLFRDFLKEFILKAAGTTDKMDTDRVKFIINKVKKVVQGYITGIILVILILAVLNSILLLAIGVKHAIFFAVFAALLNVIPFVGPLFGSILPIIYALITMDSLLYPLLIMLGFYVIQLMESNIFTPIIVGSQVSINAFVALILLYLGAQLWGIAGMILIIPIGAILKVLFDEMESLQPYGFVMGRVPGIYTTRKSIIAKKMSKFSERVSMDLRKNDQEEQANVVRNNQESEEEESPGKNSPEQQ
ncbi:AI-2E family transporter [soil metagenome]